MPPKKKAHTIKEELPVAPSEEQPPPVQKPVAEAQDQADAIVPPVSILIRSTKFYLAAGDVTLAARNSDNTDERRVVFRVNKVFLAQHSPVLATMFQSTPSPRLYDDVPLWELDSDDADTEDLLSFMYNPAALFQWLHDPQTDLAYRLADLLDIAANYEVDAVRPFVLHLLERDWPSTLTEWLRLQGEAARLRDLWTARCVGVYASRSSVDDLYPVDPASAIHLGLTHNMPSILPAAFYALSSIDVQDDWERWHSVLIGYAR